MDKALPSGGRDCGFESRLGLLFNGQKVLPGFEPGLQGSEPWVLTNYTIEPWTKRKPAGGIEPPIYRLRSGCLATWPYRLVNGSILGRVVKALDLSPSGLSPRGFEPRRMHFSSLGEKWVSSQI